LRKAAAHCRGCDLYKNATQTAFGEGARPGVSADQHRGELVASPRAPRVVATVHPSSILRARDDDAVSS